MNIELENKALPVLLITGYLGSGKTTLLNRILTNHRGLKFAVIVNDLGEVNIDADLIEKGGVVGQTDDSLVALQNGCICCTLKMDLIAQLEELSRMNRFDYIAIEASGICEPAPIAQTINSYPQLARPSYPGVAIPTLDCIVTVVDALRMKDEFGCGDALQRENIDEEDIENLVIEQIEFCNIILLNKASELTPDELGRVKSIVRALQPNAEILTCDYGDVELEKLICYCLDKEVITDEDVEAICTTRLQDRIFDMVEYVAKHQPQKALTLYYDLLAMKVEPIKIITLIARQYNLMLQARELKKRGFTSKDIASKIGVPPFAAKKYLDQAAGYKSSELRRNLEKCVSMDQAVKSGQLDGKMSVELLILGNA